MPDTDSCSNICIQPVWGLKKVVNSTFIRTTLERLGFSKTKTVIVLIVGNIWNNQPLPLIHVDLCSVLTMEIVGRKTAKEWSGLERSEATRAASILSDYK